MNEIRYNVELLSPSGNREAVVAAVNSGCGAVYIGGKSFNARAGADNFEAEELTEIINYCHLRDVKVYITVNTLYKDDELEELFAFLSGVYACGADAFIMQDIGAAAMARKYFPDIPLHASTQITAHSLEDALFLQSAGFSRVVLSRELSLNEIKHIKANSSVELECFVHGALCVCYSGQCLMSSVIGARSGNRGRCAQPCRLKYELIKNDDVIQSGHLLSPKDIVTIDILDKIIEAGVDTLKIEGRMKTPEYVALVTKAYREKINRIASGDNSTDEQMNKKLLQIFNRGGSSQGYYENYSGPDMMSIRSPKSAGLCIGYVEDYYPETDKCVIALKENLVPGDGIEIWTDIAPHAGTGISKKYYAGDRPVVIIKGNIKKGNPVYRSFDKALADEAKKIFEKDTRKICVKASVKIIAGEPIYLGLTHEKSGERVESEGSVAEKAKNQPMTEEKILAQLSKTGGTCLDVVFEQTDIGADVFVPVADLNALRRDAVEKLQQSIITSYIRPLVNIQILEDNPALPSGEKDISVLVSNLEQLNAALSFKEGIKRIYIEINQEIINDIDFLADKCSEKDISLFAALPDIDRDGADITEILEKTNIQGYLIRNLGQLYSLKNINTAKEIISDYNLNIFNRLSYKFMKEYVSRVTISQEINMDDINRASDNCAEIIVYGKTKLMATAQCPIGNYAGKKDTKKYCGLKNNSSGYCLKDRTGVKLPVITNCDKCIAYIYNDRPVFILNKTKDLLNCSAGSMRLSFTNESGEETKEIIDIAVKTLYYKSSCGEQTEKFIAEYPFTYGHFYKGAL